MSKQVWKPGNMVYPLPAVMVSCGDFIEKKDLNIITIAWTGTINTNPPLAYVSIKPSRYSYEIIKKNMDFVINLTTEDLTFQTDFCGVRSGRNIDKFKHLKLTPEKSQKVKSPSILESPVNIECQVLDIKEFASHHMFISEVVSVSADDKFMDSKNRFHLDKCKPICYSHGSYFSLGKNIGKFGFSVQKIKKS